jgi:DivIVA domain-containing protein
MAFGAEDINSQSFSLTLFRGYKVNEVDDFLDIVAAEMNKLRQANRSLEEKVAVLEKRLAESHGDGPLEDRVEELERRIL